MRSAWAIALVGLGLYPAKAASSLDAQAACSQQAALVFSAQVVDGHDVPWANKYVNHFNEKANKCFVWIGVGKFFDNGKFGVEETISDAFGLATYGSYVATGPTPTKCSVKTVDGQEISCGSEDEFRKLALRHLGIDW